MKRISPVKNQPVKLSSTTDGADCPVLQMKKQWHDVSWMFLYIYKTLSVTFLFYTVADLLS